MTPEQYRRVTDLFDVASGLDGDARRELLAAEADDAVRERVAHMLAQHDRPDPRLDAPGGGAAALRDAVTSQPKSVGRYEIVDVLGSGGMGIVYRARQQNPDREVALKMMRSAVATDSMRRRFELETQILARLSHPGVAQLFEAGTAELDGAERPWFAMELVEGEPLLDYAARHQLGTADRVRLASRVCRAVEAAHRQGVVHRDLKPGNILVTADGLPKILDFGIARATDTDIRATSMRTDVGELLGTVPYMSPEQVGGDPGAVDARSDVYSLGVVIYELLTGALPYEVREASIAEAIRVIGEVDPIPMSSTNRTLRGDLETIVAKTLEKDPGRRYRGADQLADDLDRYLADEPIVARPASAMYQLRKFARRNRALVVAATAVIVALAVASVVSTVFALRESHQRGVAETRGIQLEDALEESNTQRSRAEAMNEFLHEVLLDQASPDEVPDRDLTLHQAMTNAAAEIDTRFDDPVVRGLLHRSTGRMFWGYGDYDDAERHLRQAIDLLGRELGAGDLDTLLARRMHVSVLLQLNRLDEAMTLGTAVMEDHVRVKGPTDTETIMATNEVAMIAMRQLDLDTAISLMRDVVEGHAANVGDDGELALLAKINLAAALDRDGAFEASERLYREVIEVGDATLGPNDANILAARLNLATLLRGTDRHDEALPLAAEAHAGTAEIYGADHPRTLSMEVTVARLHRDLGDADRALELMQRVLDVRSREFGAESQAALFSMNDVAITLFALERHEEAVAQYQAALDILDSSGAEPSSLERAIHFSMGRALIALERFDEAVERMTTANEQSDLLFGPEHHNTATMRWGLGLALTGAGQFEEAETALEAAWAIRESTFGEDSSQCVQVAEAFVELYEAWAREDEAARWRARSADG